jgi:tripartite-type tricarboxylate transporter receptor subunit TctC
VSTSFTRRALLAAAAATALAAAAPQAFAADPYFGGKSIKLVVPYPAGGTSDILARLLSQRMAEALGATVVVENKAGATGNLGSDFVAKSAPDGLTLLLTDMGSVAIAPSVFPNLPYDPVKDFAPVILVAYSPHLLAARTSLPVKDVKELIALAKAKPDSINFAISGTGGANHLAGIEFALRSGIKWTYIPYKGGSQAINDVVAGQADVLFNGMVATWPMVEGGKLKALAISSAKRFPGAPNVPTVAEAAGLPGFETGSYQGIAAPAGTPPAVVATLHDTVAKILATPDMQERLAKLGAETRPGTPAEFGNFIKNEKARWAKVVKDSGAKFD